MLSASRGPKRCGRPESRPERPARRHDSRNRVIVGTVPARCGWFDQRRDSVSPSRWSSVWRTACASGKVSQAYCSMPRATTERLRVGPVARSRTCSSCAVTSALPAWSRLSPPWMAVMACSTDLCGAWSGSESKPSECVGRSWWMHQSGHSRRSASGQGPETRGSCCLGVESRLFGQRAWLPGEEGGDVGVQEPGLFGHYQRGRAVARQGVADLVRRGSGHNRSTMLPFLGLEWRPALG